MKFSSFPFNGLHCKCLFMRTGSVKKCTSNKMSNLSGSFCTYLFTLH
ncbi:unnamed protein product [Gulo gulo]|uniref:Uncharacterized protein n=1 Tax=Gulo gulo TaxID=48420 RepID=A0A9X9Q401_GULGU|nr:unnamed protein product [Gulo gulo]